MNLSRRDFLGSLACAFAVAGVASRIPRAAIVEDITAGIKIGEPVVDIPLAWNIKPGTVLRFVVTATNSGPATMNMNGMGAMTITPDPTRGLEVGDEFTLSL